jgi:uncharacterized glyoxalase superfamily protein PhnB
MLEKTYEPGAVEDRIFDGWVAADAFAAGAGARPGAETFWGGYSGVFVDPEGHAWEIAHNPRWTIRDDGSIELPA